MSQMLLTRLLTRLLPGIVAAAVLVALAAGSGTEAAPNSVRIVPAETAVPAGGEVAIAVQAEAPAQGLGSWSLTIAFDPGVVRFGGCSGRSLCNEMSSGTVSLLGFTGAGLFGTETLATLRFVAGGPAGSSTALDLAVDSFADPLGQETSPGVEDGRINVQGGTPTPKPDGEREVAWGDVDCDGGVAIGDAQKLSLSLVGIAIGQMPPCFAVGAAVGVDGAARRWGDVDCSGAVTIGDAVKLARTLVGLPVERGSGCPAVGESVRIL